MKLNVEVRFEDLELGNPNRLIVAVEKEPLPLSFNVEVGAHLNTLRSSLDILATALAHRYGIAKPNEVYFPVVRSEAVFLGGDYKGSKLVKGLPPAERALIEELKPYKGGNDRLWWLHDLDIVRKHRGLLAAEITPASIGISGFGIRDHFVPVSSGWMRADDKTVLGFWPRGRAEPKVDFTPYVAIIDGAFVESAVPALDKFARLAASIINLFN